MSYTSYTEEEIREVFRISVETLLDNLTRGRVKRPVVVTAKDVTLKINASIRYIGTVPVSDAGTLDGGELVMQLDNGQRFRLSVTELEPALKGDGK